MGVSLFTFTITIVVLEKRRSTPIRARCTGEGISTGEQGVLSRKAQLINCWLVSWEADGGSTRWWTEGQTHSSSSKISPPLPDNIIQLNN